MRLSVLQGYILGTCWNAKKKVSRAVFDSILMSSGLAAGHEGTVNMSAEPTPLGAKSPRYPAPKAQGRLHKYQMNGKRKRKDAVNAVTKSLENLIDKGLLVGYGLRTPKKWYLKETRLTSLGRRIARELQKTRQGRLFR